MTQKIIPHLWYDKDAKEAAFYTRIFPESKITHAGVIRDTPSGDCDIMSFDVWGYKFMAISAGPMFKFNPSVSFIVNFDPLFFGGSADEAREKLDAVWKALSDGGTPLMPLDRYPFSRRYGWIQDRYGLSWQLMLTNPEGDPRPTIIPSCMFTGKNCGKAEDAIKFYDTVFHDSRPGNLIRYPAGMDPHKEGTIMFGDFMLENQWFAAMDSAGSHNFTFNEAVSFMVRCGDQNEIDYYWGKLSAVPEAEQCGWLKDKYGLSWQITPAAMSRMMQNGSKEQMARLTQAFLPMKKFDLASLERAYEGK